MRTHRFAFQYAIDALCKAGAWLAAICLFVLALVVFYEVFIRYTTGHSSSWIKEFSVYLMMAVGFLAAAYALQLNSHFAITFFVDRLSPTNRRRMQISTHLVGFCYALIFVVKGVDMVSFVYAIGDTSTGLLQTPLWLPASLVPISGVLLCLQFLNLCIDSFTQEHM
ncbi:TRAP transporter small permease [Alteromonas gilva]|uniref:TRAP transporter small permease protein n=1 Tax=Alteromonas gilva TaxID=2987522 RepID=A0ABT5L2S4_9ALTE|nr:TRAP transporter small permease [Alteromonas gilva]MDC8830137.1 TRAP transporter small permease [Alteromonas gilva]